jgi:transcriptional regulator with XRE-family HTH domain
MTPARSSAPITFHCHVWRKHAGSLQLALRIKFLDHFRIPAVSRSELSISTWISTTTNRRPQICRIAADFVSLTETLVKPMVFLLWNQTMKTPLPRFREARLAAELSLRQAARRLGRSASALQKWEVGSNSPSMADLYLMAYVYETRVFCFFSEPDTFTVPKSASRQAEESLAAAIERWSRRASAADKAYAKQVVDCARILPTVPVDVAKHWIGTLKACASVMSPRKTKRRVTA